ncbi:MAG: DUF2303 family protein [Actinomycetota bacterium]
MTDTTRFFPLAEDNLGNAIDGAEAFVGAQLGVVASAPVELGDRLHGRVVPPGWSIQTVDLIEYGIGNPRIKTGGPIVYDAQSLIDYEAAQDEQARLYAEVSTGVITAVFDDHDLGIPGRRAHKATYKLRPTAEWRTLTELDGEFCGAQKFAEIIEDLQHIIGSPSTADLLDLVRKFKASKVAQLTEHHDDKSGDRVFRYETETQISDELIAPDAFTFVLPVYHGQEDRKVDARFRYRAGSGGVQFGLRLVQRELVLEAAFETEVDAVEAGVGGGRAIRGTCG